jgi:hypothetical protein
MLMHRAGIKGLPGCSETRASVTTPWSPKYHDTGPTLTRKPQNAAIRLGLRPSGHPS